MSSRLAEPAVTLSAIIWQAVLMLKFYTVVINPGLGLDYRTVHPSSFPYKRFRCLNYQNAVTAVLAGKLEPQSCTVETRSAKGNNADEEIVFTQDTFWFNFAVFNYNLIRAVVVIPYCFLWK